MENIYLKKEELSWKKIVRFALWILLIGTFLIILKYIKIVQVDPQEIFDYLYSMLIIIILFQVINPRLNKCIVDEIKFRTESLNTIITPAVTAVGLRIGTDALQCLPILFGGKPISVGKWQTNMELYNPIEKLAIGTILGPCLEELLFRVVFFTYILYLLGYIDDKRQTDLSSKAINFNSAFCWMIIIINNTIFSLMHGPNIYSFWLYFLGGVADTIIYIKYGFYSSWISHGLFNYLHFPYIILGLLHIK